MLNHISKIFKSSWAQVVFALLCLNFSYFYKLYLFKLLPFPGDLLVSFYFPWNSGGFVGYDSWTTHKNMIAADAIRQIYPWKNLAIDLFKSFQWPLWNPYNFSGTPLLANLQSSVFFPGNVFYFILPFTHAWIFQVIILLSVFAFFTYMFLRSLQRSHLASIFGAICAGGMSYLLVWQEQLIIIQSALFLPIILFGINQISINSKSRFQYLIPLLLAFSILGGHIQTVLYVYILSGLYMFYRRINLLDIIKLFFLSIVVGSIQLLPSIQLYIFSAREVSASDKLFFSGVLPIKNLVTLIAPDFFGNPAVNNFWGSDYGNFSAYFGVVAIMFSFVGLVFRRHRESMFWSLVFIISLIFASYPALVFQYLKIPILSSSTPARLLFLTQFSGVVLSSFGLDSLLEIKNKISKRIYLILGVVPICLLLLYGLTFFIRMQEMIIARNNLKLSLTISLVAIFMIFLLKSMFKRVPQFVLVAILLVFSIFEYSYFFNKYSPFSSDKFIYPTHTVISYLQNNVGFNRYYGFWSAYIDNNFATQLRTYSPEGYDSLYLKRYGQLVKSADNGVLNSDIQRSDAYFIQEDNYYRQRLFDILGVKYILDKNDDPKKSWEPEPLKFPTERYQLVWQDYKWKSYERTTALPRVALFGKYEIEKNDQKLIERLYSKDFDYKNTLLIESDHNIAPVNDGLGRVDIKKYSPNSVEIETSSPTSKILLLTDTYYPGWKATIDGKEVPIYRADFALRSILVPGGEHNVKFEYDPVEFKVGLVLTFSGLVFIGYKLIRRKE